MKALSLKQVVQVVGLRNYGLSVGFGAAFIHTGSVLLMGKHI